MERGCFLSGESTLTLPLCLRRSARWDHSTTPAPLAIAERGRIRRRGVTYDGLICYFSLDDDALRDAICAAIEESAVPCWPAPAWLASIGDRRPVLARAKAAGLLLRRIELVDRASLVDTCATFAGPCVVKVGNHHAGIGKYLIRNREDAIAVATEMDRDVATVEDFVEGDSFRIFVAGGDETEEEEILSFRYDNATTWIKNADGCEVVRDTAPPAAIEHARRLHQLLQRLPASSARRFEGTGLSGIDYIRDTAGEWHCLEWNGYPWVSGDPDVERLAKRTFERAMTDIESASG